MKKCALFILVLQAAAGQTGTGSIQGVVLDRQTQKPVPTAIVTALRAGFPPFSKNTKSGGAGEFRLQELTPGNYSLCVQTAGDRYLNSCDWNGTAVAVSLTAGQAVPGVALRLTPASVLVVEVRDPQNAMRQRTGETRRPGLLVGVWGGRGLFYPAHDTATGSANGRIYSLAVPRDTALDLHIASDDLRLGDSAGLALAAGAERQSFRHNTGDLRPRSFVFTVLGRSR